LGVRSLRGEELTYRVGIGHDTHRLGSGGPLVLGGLELDHDRHAIGHSDADVLLHSITDAILGAASLGDIGELFPDSDPANKGKDSAEMLQAAVAMVQQAGFKVVNLDCIVFAQRPKLSPHKLAIRDRIGQILDINAELVGVKAKTGESVGPIGREEAISAQCVALLEVASENHG
jgi:2-C-methyl-D-erythritol 2,4-cyclodiphosphate synthase